jgi:CubicO group peptidase (beta-lactamase class C family)
MRRSAVVILIALLTITISYKTSAQSQQQQKVDSVFQLVKKYINARQPDSIYALTGEKFRANIDLEKFREASVNNLFPLGQLNHSLLITFDNNSIATYKVSFGTNVTLQLLLRLDDKDKLTYFLFQAYQGTNAAKLTLAASSNLLKTTLDKKIDTAARAYIQKANTVGLSIGIFKNGKIYTYNYGETTKGNNTMPTDNTLFEIGSITKTFTSTLLAYYVNEGKLRLTDPVTNYLPDSVAANPELKQITVEELSNHTSGLVSVPDNLDLKTDSINPYINYNKRQLFAYLKTCKLKSTPGEKYSYSNLAVGLLGVILETITGKTYSQMVAEIVTKPLNMHSTVQQITPALKPRFTTVYNGEGNPTPPWQFNVLAPCGALHSTVSDLLLFARANLTPGPGKLSKALQLTQQITFNKDIKIGLAWHITTINGVDYYFHGGLTYGSSSFLAFNIEKNIAIVILSNSCESTDAVGVNILKKLQ